ncbi:MAG TPA: serine hydrolase domain-containing protein, partial [Gemmatimonadaceae bacterium]|nr:serine hydrolase domain-containing protein [Gemmatimonadaceae bacterium]
MHETAAGARGRLAMTRYQMHGMSGSIMLVDSGRVVLHEGYGLADRERRIPASTSTIYDVGSITKTFTAAAILRLVGDGKIDLRAPIARYFADVPADKANITVDDILTHTAGFALDPSNAGINAEDSYDIFVAKALKAPLIHNPRSAYSYSNLGYGLLAIIVERVSGENFRSFVTRTLITPSQLANTRWWSDSAAMTGGDAARGYEFSDRESV